MDSLSRPADLVITVSGPIADTVLDQLHNRYDRVTTSRPGTDTVVTVAGLDQPGERAVLNLLWDTGHQVRSVNRGGKR